MQLKRTPLYEEHVALGARMVDFGGWEMPVQYVSILKEHAAVREQAGLFDVSHMGVIEIRGSRALEALQYLLPNNLARLSAGQGLYTQLCNPQGGVLDDLLVFCLDAERWWLVVNASNREPDLRWVQSQLADFGLEIAFQHELGMIALQGPAAEVILASLSQSPVDSVHLPGFGLRQLQTAEGQFWVSRSGYTGEDGFELYVPHDQLVGLWRALLEAGKPHGLQPAGLGARDTLRLEAAMPLYGHELDDQTTPLEAGLGWSVKLDKPMDFIGKAALLAQKADGLSKKRLGFQMTDARRAPRQGYTLFVGEQAIGQVTSGSLSPTLGYPIGMAYVDSQWAENLSQCEVDIRGQRYAAQIVKMPFYRRKV